MKDMNILNTCTWLFREIGSAFICSMLVCIVCQGGYVMDYVFVCPSV